MTVEVAVNGTVAAVEMASLAMGVFVHFVVNEVMTKAAVVEKGRGFAKRQRRQWWRKDKG